jgi:hypothetical protein
VDALPALQSPRGGSRRGSVAVVAACCAIFAVVVAGKVRRRHCSGNESAAIATLRNLCSVQLHMQAQCAWDPDGTGLGGFGFFAELRGEAGVRGRGAPAWGQQGPPLGAAFVADEFGYVRRNGYVFALFLPAKDGGWATERDAANGRAIDEAKARELWVCYAWPEHPGWTGSRAFVISQSGVLTGHGNTDAKFGGDVGPTPGVSGFASARLGSRFVVNAIDCLGDLWWIVG